MKKNYSKPEVSTINVEVSHIIAGSEMTNSIDGLSGTISAQGGGTLEGGTGDAASYRNNLWDN